jgi:hypothetical protein
MALHELSAEDEPRASIPAHEEKFGDFGENATCDDDAENYDEDEYDGTDEDGTDDE